MTHRSVKQSPHLDRVEETMHGIGTLGTFMGSDLRKLYEILTDDHDVICSLGLTHDIVAARLEDITRKAKEALGDVIEIENRYEVKAEEARGSVPCPWQHPAGLFRKSRMELRDLRTGRKLLWTDLSIHMIRAHGFYQGRGSPYRLEPRDIKNVLFS